MLLSSVMMIVTALSSEKGVVTSVIAFDDSTKVSRGDEGEIILNAVPNYGNTITFEIERPPLHGTLTPPLNQSDHTALVIYRHDGKKGVLEDGFSFRVKSVGRAKSIAYKINIHILPPPALLTFEPQMLNFGAVMVSEKSQKNITITNIGGKKTTGRLLLPKGFTAPEGDGFTLNEDQSTQITISFSPIGVGDVSEEASLLPSLEKEALILKGSGRPRYEISKRAALEWEIKNLSPNSIRINFTGGEGWVMPTETLFSPKQNQIISFQQIEQTEVETKAPEKNTSVSISDGMSTNEIELPQPTRFIPLSVQQISQESLGTALIGSSLPVSFRFHNRSQSTKEIKWSASSASGGGMSEPKLVKLRGGEINDVSFTWIPSLPGAAVLKVSVFEGSKLPQEFFWKATVFAGSITPESSSQPFPIGLPTEQRDEEIPASPTPAEVKPIPPVNEATWGVEVSWLGRQRAFITWNAGSESQSRVSLEEIHLVQSDISNANHISEASKIPTSVRLESVALTGFNQVRKENHEMIKLPELSPGWHLIRLTLNTVGNSTPDASSQLQVMIPQKTSVWNICKMPIGILLLIFLLLFLWGRKWS